MALHYDLYENPPGNEEDKKGNLHARVVISGTVGIDELAEKINFATSLTKGDVISTLQSLTDIMIEELLQGKQVFLKGLGYFRLSLEAPPIDKANDIRSESIRVKTIQFQPDKKVKGKLTYAKPVRVRKKRISRTCNSKDLEKLIDNYLEKNAYITASVLREISGYSRSRVNYYLKKFVDDGKLKKSGLFNFPLYEKCMD